MDSSALLSNNGDGGSVSVNTVPTNASTATTNISSNSQYADYIRSHRANLQHNRHTSSSSSSASHQQRSFFPSTFALDDSTYAPPDYLDYSDHDPRPLPHHPHNTPITLHLPNGRNLQGCDIVRYRCAENLLLRLSWAERTKRSKLALIGQVALGVGIAMLCLIVGAQYLKTDWSVYDTPSSSSSSSSTNTPSESNMCSSLPVYLLIAGTLVLTAMLIITIFLAIGIRCSTHLEKISLSGTLLLILLAGFSFILTVIGTIWLLNTHACPTTLYRTVSFTLITTYCVAAAQICVGCMRRCCEKEILPV